MKLHYYRETDSLYIEFRTEPGIETREIVEGLNVDLDADGNVVGFDIDNATRLLDLSALETEALTLNSFKAEIGPDAQAKPDSATTRSLSGSPSAASRSRS